MNIITQVHFPQAENLITNDAKGLSIGSCFSENIGKLLYKNGFDVCVNAFGTVFNPWTIAKHINRSLAHETIVTDEIKNYGERYFHFDYHTSFDKLDRMSVLEKCNESLSIFGTYLRTADYLIITFGSSIVYNLIDNDEIVGNCHKLPQSHFKKTLLEISTSLDVMEDAITKLRKLNPTIKIILTVSPVRHTKEGIIHNTRSKARLIELCQLMSEKIANTVYFPAYEIMMDELRDYRYYTEDLIHPNQLAIGIIWQRFINAFFDDKSKTKIDEFERLDKALSHKPFNAESNEHRQFCHRQLEIISSLQSKYPDSNFESSIAYFERFLI